MTEKEQILFDLFGFGADRANYLINISSRYKYIYFETPKVGCSTIKNTLQTLEVDDESELPPWVHDKHLSPLLSPLVLEKNFTEYLNDEYFKFSFVRNPYTRILSCYLDKILGIEKDVMLPKLGFKPTDYLSFKDFLLAIKKQSYSDMDVHWMPQSILLAEENIILDFIGRQENFDNDLKKILARITKSDSDSLEILNEIPHSVTANKKLHKYLTKDIEKLIQEIYYDDFHLYRYNTDPFYTGQLPSLPISAVDTSTESNLVSIIIPCYNQAQYLEESVQSAVDQTYPNIEIIIVNDGSSDNTQEVAERLQKKHPKLIRVINQKNQGLSEARNNGIRASLGDYILPLDSDDKIAKSMVSKSINTLIHNNTDIVSTDAQCFGKETYKITPVEFPECNLLYANCWVVCSLYRRNVWVETGGYKKNMEGGYEDWEFWINAYKHGFKFLRYPEVLFYYRIKEVSMYTAAKGKDAYLRSKIIINNPELYPIFKVQEAITKIGITEELADLYFYSAIDLSIDEEYLAKAISKGLSSSELQEEQFINIPDTNKKIGLFALDTIKNTKLLKQPYKETEADFILFYAPIRYEIKELYQCRFAWEKDRGIIKAEGTLFPYVLKKTRVDPRKQLLAYERLLQYEKNIVWQTQQRNDKIIKQFKQMQSEINMLKNNKWYRFGQMSRKRKIWTIGKVMSKKIKLYWLIRPIVKYNR